MIESEIAIVGCGPVGALMANLLGRRGVRTVVLEKATEIHPLPRAVGMDDEVMRVLQLLDLDAAYTEDVYSLKGMDLLRGNRSRLRRIRLNSRDETLGFPLLTLFHQPTLEGHIRDGVNRYADNVDVRLGVDVRTIRDLADSVEIDMVNTETGEEETVSARYVLGCDGGRSFVRATFGIEQEDLGLHQPWVVVDTLMKRPIEVSGYAEQICGSKRPGTFIPSPPPRNRWEFMIMPGDELEKMTRPETLNELIRPWADPEDYEVERAAIYTFHALIAKKWRMGQAGNILILGDAAHQMPPFLGQGMCAGVRDAINLAWKLDLVLRGLADTRLLDTFQSERSQHVRKIIQVAVRIGKIIQSPSRIQSFIANALMVLSERFGIEVPIRPTKSVPLGPGFYSAQHATSQHLRCPFPQPLVSNSEGKTVRLDECLGSDFTLIFRNLDIGDVESGRCADLVKPIQVVGSGDSVSGNALVDIEGVIGNWMDEHRCDAVLLRPDRQPYGVYKDDCAAMSYVLEDLMCGLGMGVQTNAAVGA